MIWKYSLILFSFYVFFQCKPGEQSPAFFLPNASNDPIISLNYALQSGIEGNDKLLPILRETDSSICLDSRDINELDYGPRLSICVPKDSYNIGIFENFYLALLKPSEIKGYPEDQLAIDGGNLTIDFPSEATLAKDWKLTPPSHWILLDKSFQDRLKESRSIWVDGQESFLGFSYALPYWNYIESDRCAFLFSTWDRRISKSERKILRISLPCELTSPKIREFIESTKKINEHFKANCEESNPILEEIFQSTSSQFSRYFEIKNPKNYSLCIEKFYWREQSLEDEINFNSIENRLGFIFPKSHLIYKDNDSDIEGIRLPSSFPWTKINSENFSIGISNLGKEFSISNSNFSKLVSFKEENEYFSKEFNSLPCGLRSPIYFSTESFCGTPGWSPNSEKYLDSFCKPNDIQLTEIQANGIQLENGITFSQDRFLEFQVHLSEGKSSCDISSLFLRVGSDSFPLSATKQIINNSEIFMVTLSQKFPSSTIKIPRNLSRMNWQSAIQMESLSADNYSRIYRNSSEPKFVEKNTNGILFSLEWKGKNGNNDLFLHHKNTKINYDKSLSFMNASPGYVNEPRIHIKTNSQITEVLWSGSYFNSVSILNDRFVEWINESDDSESLIVRMEFPDNITRNQSYLVPIEKGIQFLSKGNSTCFPLSRGLIHKDFTLYNSDMILTILDAMDGTILDSVSLDSNVHGMNSTSPKIRRSAEKNKQTDVWGSSLSNSENCSNQTYANPGEWK
jgi:hypothetical protein